MKLGILGDLHITSRGPSRRLDNFLETQMSKLSQASSIFHKNNCEYIIQPGDLFDTHTVSNEVKAKIIELLKNEPCYEKGLLFVSGQHDISGHSLHTLKNSPLAVLQASKVGILLSVSPQKLDTKNSDGGVEFRVYGASYGEPIPNPENKGEYNILVLHKMIGDRELFPGQELTKPNQFLRNNPDYQLVICGDYHYRFSSQYQGRTIINAGCLVRKTIGKFDLEHKPSIAIFDTDTSEVKFVELEVEPIEKVFDLSRENQRDKMSTEKFIKAMKEKRDSGSGINIKNLLIQILAEKKSSEKVRNVIDECMEEVQK